MFPDRCLLHNSLYSSFYFELPEEKYAELCFHNSTGITIPRHQIPVIPLLGTFYRSLNSTFPLLVFTVTSRAAAPPTTPSA